MNDFRVKPELQYLERPRKPSLAYVYSPSENKPAGLPAVMFLGGYRSDMNGTKAVFLEKQCHVHGQAYLRFDYSGHGQSEGIFEHGTISDWAQDALDIFDRIIDAPVILVGSSMGGWIGLLIAQKRQNFVKALIGIAAAPDFTEAIFNRLSHDQKSEFLSNGVVSVANDYSNEPYRFTQTFYKDGKKNLILKNAAKPVYPIRLIQGCADKDVPKETAQKIIKSFGLAPESATYIQDGDHRLSRPQDLEVIWAAIKEFS